VSFLDAAKEGEVIVIRNIRNTANDKLYFFIVINYTTKKASI